MTDLRRTPLFALHERLGGRMVPFAGFAMPVQYGSIVDEHRAAREAAALFDVSHMGQIALAGEAAGEFADRLCTRAMSTLAPGRVRYALLCNESGGVIDDLTVYRTGADSFLLCVNAANTAADLAWIEKQAGESVTVLDESEETGLLALQGPASARVLIGIGGAALSALRRFQFAHAELAGCAVLASRTGYTGADGFELYCAARDAVRLFEALLEAGRAHGLLPAGLGARDTLRLEAALPLYGQELDTETTPLEAGLERFVELDRDFLGAAAMRRRRDAGFARALVGFEIEGRGIARAGYPVVSAGNPVGRVTSGGPSPTLSRAIGLAYVPRELAAIGTALEIEVRGRAIPARVVETPSSRARPPDARTPDRARSSDLAETQIPKDLHYSAQDEWARIEGGDRVAVGITDYAQQQLGDIVFVELPAVGTALTRDATFGVIESVKAVSDLYAPLSGEVVAVNEALTARPELVNEACYGEGWMLVIRPSGDATAGLMDAAAYAKYVEERS